MKTIITTWRIPDQIWTAVFGASGRPHRYTFDLEDALADAIVRYGMGEYLK